MLNKIIFIIMTGSFIITYLDDIETGGDYIDISRNGVFVKRIYNQIEDLYSTPLVVNDVVSVTYVPFNGFTSEFTLTRRDYTTDAEGDDNGIKETVIASDIPLTTYTFTATTVNNAYDFVYMFENNVQSNFQIWTEASEPIMTENDEYINQQF